MSGDYELPPNVVNMNQVDPRRYSVEELAKECFEMGYQRNLPKDVQTTLIRASGAIAALLAYIGKGDFEGIDHGD